MLEENRPPPPENNKRQVALSPAKSKKKNKTKNGKVTNKNKDTKATTPQKQVSPKAPSNNQKYYDEEGNEISIEEHNENLERGYWYALRVDPTTNETEVVVEYVLRDCLSVKNDKCWLHWKDEIRVNDLFTWYIRDDYINEPLYRLIILDRIKIQEETGVVLNPEPMLKLFKKRKDKNEKWDEWKEDMEKKGKFKYSRFKK